MIIELRKYIKVGELLIRNNHRVKSTSNLSGRRPDSICSSGSCPHGGGRNRDANRAQGHIQIGSESGMSVEMQKTTAEQSKKC